METYTQKNIDKISKFLLGYTGDLSMLYNKFMSHMKKNRKVSTNGDITESALVPLLFKVFSTIGKKVRIQQSDIKTVRYKWKDYVAVTVFGHVTVITFYKEEKINKL